MTKTCSKCKIDLPSFSFSKDSSRRDGLQRYCKSCVKDYSTGTKQKIHNKARILILDIETTPIIAHVWRLWDNNVGLNQIVSDWHLMSWSAKWLGEEEIMYLDQRDKDDISDDRDLLEQMWYLLDEADIIVTQNGKKFDEKKLNARFILNGMKPPSSYKHVDTVQIARRKFGFTSNKLAYMTDKLCTKHKKLTHAKFPGHELWTECMKGNLEAWDEMRDYNEVDVLSLEELYLILKPWDNSVNYALWVDEDDVRVCNGCGGHDMRENGYYYTASGKYQKYRCNDCGHESRDRTNLKSKMLTRKL